VFADRLLIVPTMRSGVVVRARPNPSERATPTWLRAVADTTNGSCGAFGRAGGFRQSRLV